MTLADFARYQAKWDSPVYGTYRGKSVISTPPPTSGAVMIAALNVLDKYPAFPDQPLNTHRLVEILKHGYAQRGFYGDPVDPVYTNITQLAKYFTGPKVAQDVFSKVNDSTTFEPLYYQPSFDIKEDRGTMHVSVVSGSGDAVSLTSTVNLLFGCKIMDPLTGIILNNEMDDFSIPGVPNAFGLAPSPYNYICNMFSCRSW